MIIKKIAGDIKMNFSNDKIKHLIAGFVICVAGYFFISAMQNYFPLPCCQASLAGLLLSFVAGFLKELYDKFVKKTCFDWLDWAVTNVGGISGFIAIEIMTSL